MTMIPHSPDRYHVREDAATRFGEPSLVVDLFIHRIYIAYFGSIASSRPFLVNNALAGGCRSLVG